MSYFWTGIRVGNPARKHPSKRIAQVAYAVRGDVSGIVGEDFEGLSSYDVLALRHRGTEVTLIHADDGEIGPQEEIIPRGGIEDGLKSPVR
jgi:hypothetical protein